MAFFVYTVQQTVAGCGKLIFKIIQVILLNRLFLKSPIFNDNAPLQSDHRYMAVGGCKEFYDKLQYKYTTKFWQFRLCYLMVELRTTELGAAAVFTCLFDSIFSLDHKLKCPHFCVHFYIVLHRLGVCLDVSVCVCVCVTKINNVIMKHFYSNVNFYKSLF